MITEDFLHYVWRYSLFNLQDLQTDEGEGVTILKTGEHNFNSGPDFFNAQIKIGNTIWAGNVEIHVHSSDWEKHMHQHDKAYESIILHVVYKNDVPIYRSPGKKYPTLVLKGLLPKKLLDNYLTINKSKHKIPCRQQLKEVDAFTVNKWLERLLIERLERKTESILQKWERNKNNWEETFYQQIAQCFGFKINSEPFEQLTRSLPNNLLAKQKNSLLQTEALLYGQAGLLNESFTDKYPKQLQNEYVFLQRKYKLTPMEKYQWKNMRLHPTNFPTIRIAQFAALVHTSTHLFSKVMEVPDRKSLIKLFEVETSAYWNEHFQFDKQSVLQKKKLGKDAINTIIINSIIPLYFAYGKVNKEEAYINKALAFLEETQLEKNAIISQWKEMGIASTSAGQTQALLQLKNEYCSKKKCLHCAIGNKLMNKV